MRSQLATLLLLALVISAEAGFLKKLVHN